jgi:membrane protease YdiL (CAAX protease family)
LIVLGFIVQAFAEELFFRGYLMISISRVRPLSVGVLISALFFALFHRTSAAISPLGLLNLFLLGLVLALFAVRCGNLFGSVALHAVYLVFEGALLGSPVDGQAMPAAFAALSFTEGNAFLHGGAYGLGGGLAAKPKEIDR